MHARLANVFAAYGYEEREGSRHRFTASGIAMADDIRQSGVVIVGGNVWAEFDDAVYLINDGLARGRTRFLFGQKLSIAVDPGPEEIWEKSFGAQFKR